jgi:hypothetical protein
VCHSCQGSGGDCCPQLLVWGWGPPFQDNNLHNLHLHDVAFVVVWNVLAADENDSVSTFADAGDDFSKTSEFLYVGFGQQFVALGVY